MSFAFFYFGSQGGHAEVSDEQQRRLGRGRFQLLLFIEQAMLNEDSAAIHARP